MLRRFTCLLVLFAAVCAPARSDDFTYTTVKVPYSRYLAPGTLTVVASFDGSYNLERWRDILEFARENQVKFTFFVSGVYLIPSSEKTSYQYPPDPLKHGISDIGFGGASTEVATRLRYIDRALSEGHDIESHLNGHFDGTRWSEPMWRLEFNEFNRFASFLPRPVSHVRFPLLAMNHQVFPILAEYNIRSIVSVVEADYENFNRITVDYRGKPYRFIEFPIAYERENKERLILMDYNFYVYDEQHHLAPDKSEDMMVALYLDEAQRCFKENRPFFISHHFSNWNHAAYWDAMKKTIVEIKKKYPTEFITVTELYDKVSR